MARGELAECEYDIMIIQATNHEKDVHYVIDVSWSRGMYMYGIYYTEARWCEAHEGWGAILSVRDVTIIHPVGTTTIDTHRTLENEEASLSYLKRSHKAAL